MNYRALIAETLYRILLEPEKTADQKKEEIEKTLRSYSVHTLNTYAFLRDKNIEDNTLKEIMQQNDLDFNLKTRKFF